MDINNNPSTEMWTFDMSVRQWAWVSGCLDLTTMYYNYGTMGVAGTPNTPNQTLPSARYSNAMYWNAGQLWIYGGDAQCNGGLTGAPNGTTIVPTNGVYPTIADLWMFDGTAMTWYIATFLDSSHLSSVNMEIMDVM
jgi:hypothetical protein